MGNIPPSVLSELNMLALQRQGGLVQRAIAFAPLRQFPIPSHLSYWFTSPTAHTSNPCCGLRRKCAYKPMSATSDTQTTTGENMIHKEVINHIARRLPHQQQREVREVIDLLMEVWSDELMRGNEVIVPTIGKLSIDVQDIKAGGALINQGRLQRVYGRFRPTPTFKHKIKEQDIE